MKIKVTYIYIQKEELYIVKEKGGNQRTVFRGDIEQFNSKYIIPSEMSNNCFEIQ